MIISQTPVRLSLLGGGTDYLQHGSGLVVGGAINKYSYITCRELPKFFNYKTRLAYSKIETIHCHEEIEHKAIKACIEACGMDNQGLEISHMSDFPGYSGTGSSSTFIVSLLHALRTLAGESPTAYDLYLLATRVQHEILKESVGVQDQAWAAYGGLNYIEFESTSRIRVIPLTISTYNINTIQESLSLFFTGFHRTSSDICSSYQIGETEHNQLVKLARKGVDAIENHDMERLGKLLHENWLIKQSFSDKVSNKKLNNLYQLGMDAGAYGGKIIGAGGGGCIVFCSHPHHTKVILRQAMLNAGLTHVPFKFDFKGSRIIYHGK